MNGKRFIHSLHVSVISMVYALRCGAFMEYFVVDVRLSHRNGMETHHFNHLFWRNFPTFNYSRETI